MSSFLALEGLHAFVTGAQGGIGSAIVKELLGKTTPLVRTSRLSIKDMAN